MGAPFASAAETVSPPELDEKYVIATLPSVENDAVGRGLHRRGRRRRLGRDPAVDLAAAVGVHVERARGIDRLELRDRERTSTRSPAPRAQRRASPAAPPRRRRRRGSPAARRRSRPRASSRRSRRRASRGRRPRRARAARRRASASAARRACGRRARATRAASSGPRETSSGCRPRRRASTPPWSRRRPGFAVGEQHAHDLRRVAADRRAACSSERGSSRHSSRGARSRRPPTGPSRSRGRSRGR